MKVLSIFGTRPEAIKMAPVVRAIKASDDFESTVCVTAQHRELLDQVLAVFEIRPDYDLDIMQDNQGLAELTARTVNALTPILVAERPDVVLVQGDTTTTFCGALAAFYQEIPVGHIEAGLRTDDVYSPFPEEMNRRLTSALATMHFAPTREASENLVASGVSPSRIRVVGNTVVDAVHAIRRLLDEAPVSLGQLGLDPSKPIVLVTAHRRENFGAPLENVCLALRILAERDDVQFVFPVHPNPNVQKLVFSHLDAHPNIFLTEPLDYVSFVRLLTKSRFVITDSGGLQEEAPSLGKPVLLLRKTTERPEVVQSGNVKLVGTSRDAIVDSAHALLDQPGVYREMSEAVSPYGDGTAAIQILTALKEALPGG